MKATELMVGDWVNSDFGIFQITEIFEDAVRDDHGNRVCWIEKEIEL